jgi:hypothetical protein
LSFAINKVCLIVHSIIKICIWCRILVREQFPNSQHSDGMGFL